MKKKEIRAGYEPMSSGPRIFDVRRHADPYKLHTSNYPPHILQLENFHCGLKELLCTRKLRKVANNISRLSLDPPRPNVNVPANFNPQHN